MKNIVIYSGGALGADSVWAMYAEYAGVPKENIKHIIAYGMKRPTGGSIALRQQEQQTGTNHYCTEDYSNLAREELAKMGIMCREDKLGNLTARNYWQVKFADTVYAITAIKEGKAQGGTATACECAIYMDKPLYVLNTEDCCWYKGTKEGYTKVDNLPKLEGKVAMVGTRNIVRYFTPKGQNNYIGPEKEDKIRDMIASVFGVKR